MNYLEQVRSDIKEINRDIQSAYRKIELLQRKLEEAQEVEAHLLTLDRYQPKEETE